jgi:hypothetical protein
MNEITQVTQTVSNLRIFCIGSEPFFNEDWSQQELKQKDKIIDDEYEH